MREDEINGMLQLKNISKSYTTGSFTQTALDDVSLDFRKNEFVAILGPSGSGKTTSLNIIGGLDQYDSGDLIINGTSTKAFKDSDWDAYRNNSVGFIFQSYNLISHLSITDNVEMGMTLSGVSADIKHRKAVEALEKVGLKDHIHKNRASCPAARCSVSLLPERLLTILILFSQTSRPAHLIP